MTTEHTHATGRIRVLPPQVANQIAAGEVVERPASVLKELMENALDAGARKIAVTLQKGGRALVAVADDGAGMTREDATLCLERQATSKIRDVTDIEAIMTFGFRGEAIPSIASVSRFTLTTRRHESDEGTQIRVNAGQIDGIATAGCPPGTLVEVRDLFCNVPARRKFLRTVATEENHLRNVFTAHALANPHVAFTLTIDGRETHNLAPASTPADRVRELFGETFSEALLPVAETTLNDIRISGFIERPNLATPTRRDQYIFINGRPASAPAIGYALREAYPRRQGDVRPSVILFLTVPPREVDVNVHPTKREVRFRQTAAVKSALAKAIAQTLSFRETVGARAFETAAFSPAGADFARPEPTPAEGSVFLARPSSTAFSAVRAPADLPAAPAAAAAPEDDALPLPPQPLARPAPIAVDLPLPAEEETARPWAWFTFLAITASGYLLIETDAGVVTINPHAARERIAFENLKRQTLSQPLLIPETVHFPPADFARILGAQAEIEAMGFKFEPFGHDTLKIDAIPQLVDGLSPGTILATIARDLADAAGHHAGGGRWRDEIVARSVAKSFAGMSLALTEDGAVKLVEELAACRMPYACPRGKPIMIFTSTRELNRKFSRD